MLQNIPKEKILEVVNQGPTFPSKIAKALGAGGDTMLIGAILSTLIGTGEVKVSTLKVGGSPLYYAPDQESKLEEFVSYLNEKDKRTFQLLKEQKILQDSEQDPLTRVSLRGIKDFAKQFEYEIRGQKLLCWRFYSLSKEEALLLAKKTFTVKPVEKPVEIEVEEAVEPVHESHHETHVHEVVEQKPVDIVQQVLEEPEKSEHTKHEHKTHEKHVTHEHHETHAKPHVHAEKHVEKHAEKEKVEKIETVEAEEQPKVEVPHTEVPHIEKAPKVPKAPKMPKAPKAPKLEYNFYDLILNHVASKKLDVISKEKVKKTEYDLILKNHENNEYIYCKAKDKPTISEGDLAPALIFAQNKKMPCMFISTGELTKTASILITREFSGMTFEKIVVSNNG